MSLVVDPTALAEGRVTKACLNEFAAGRVSQWNTRGFVSGESAQVVEVDTRGAAPNNARMGNQEAVRRIKNYSAASGYVFQYQFHEVNPVSRGSASGNEYIYYVSADRKTMFPLRILVRRDAIDRWTKQTGRAFTGTEEYAVAKMRLFAAFDEIEDLATSRPELNVDDSNLAALVELLDL